MSGQGDSILKQLILENRRRIAVYERACRELEIFDINYQVLFRELSAISKQIIAELEPLLDQPQLVGQDNQPFDEPFTSFHLDNILTQCEWAEIKIREAYNHALSNVAVKPYLEVIQRHQQLLSAALEKLTRYKFQKK